MKKTILLISFLMFSFFSSFAVVKTWVGTGGNKLWNNASNWSTPGVPSVNDDVLVNISDSIEVNQAVIINSLTVTNNVTVIFSVALTTSRRITLTSTSLSTLGLLINAGSTVYIQSKPTSATLTLRLDMTGAQGVTGEIHGNLIFRKFGNGIGGTNNQLVVYSTATQYASLVVKGTGIIKYEPDTDNTDDNTAMQNITLENGSLYWVNKNGGSFPNAIYAANSLIRKTGDCSSITGFNSSIYGNFEWDCPTQTFAHFLNKDLTFNNVSILNDGTGSFTIRTGPSVAVNTILVNGSLNVNSGCLFNLTSGTVTAGNGVMVNVQGDIINNGVIYSAGVFGTIGDFSLTGNTQQVISGSGLYANALVFKLNGNGGALLNNNVNISCLGMNFTNGKINTNTFILSIQSTVSITSPASTQYNQLNAAGYSNFGNENSYVVGKLSITGLTAVTKKAFPVGSATTHRPIFLNNATGDYMVEYSTNNPRIAIGNSMGIGLDHISAMEYWDITNTGGTANIEPSFYDPNSGGVTNMTDLRVARFSGTQWDDVSQLPPVLNTTYFGTAGSNGSILSTAQASFGAFTLASATSQNPLPVKDIKLNYTKTNNLIKLKWIVLGDEDVLSYTVETSNNGILFIAIDNIFSLNQTGANQYNFNILPSNQNVFYRIKAKLKDNQIVYSNIVRVLPNNLLLTIYPNPVKATIQLNDIMEMDSYIILNSLGNIVQQQKLTSNTTNRIAINKLPKGVYYLKVMYLNGSVKSCKFIKD